MIRTVFSLMPPSSRASFVAYVGLTALSTALRAAGVVVLMPLLEALFGPTPGSAWPWTAALVGLTAAGWILDGYTVRLGSQLGFELLNSTHKALTSHASRIRAQWFNSDNTATLRQAFSSTGPELVGLLIYLVAPMMGAVLMPLMIGCALLFVSLPLGAAALLGTPILLGAYWASGKLGREANAAAARAQEKLGERIIEFARTQQALRAARQVASRQSLTHQAVSHQHGAIMRLLLMQIPGQLLFSLASQIALVLFAGTAMMLWTQEAISAAQAIALLVVTVRYLEAFTVLAELSGGVEPALEGLRRIRAVVDAPAIAQGPNALPPRDDAGEGNDGTAAALTVELKDVTFSYDKSAGPVLQGISVRFEPGTTTAIVGPSGSGKSSLLSLLAGLYEPDSGQILINGIDAATLSESARREAVSMVFQHPYLFEGTIEDNIRSARPSSSTDDLAAAAHLARVDDIAQRLPEGYGTYVGEAGGTLSGGERQRISIARALIKPAGLLLVDEPTSALDSENEQAIAQALSADKASRTRIIVDHRLTSIDSAERVIFVEDGRVVEDGAPDELLAANGRFADFWRQRHAAQSWHVGN